MALVGLSMLLPRRGEGDPGVHLTAALTRKLAPVGLLTGLAAGFFGIGGGMGAVAGVPLANRLAGHADLARRIFAVMVIATAGYVAWRARG